MHAIVVVLGLLSCILGCHENLGGQRRAPAPATKPPATGQSAKADAPVPGDVKKIPVKNPQFIPFDRPASASKGLNLADAGDTCSGQSSTTSGVTCACPQATITCSGALTPGAYASACGAPDCIMAVSETTCQNLGVQDGQTFDPSKPWSPDGATDAVVIDQCTANHEARHLCDDPTTTASCQSEQNAYATSDACLHEVYDDNCASPDSSAACEQLGNAINSGQAANYVNRCICAGTTALSCLDVCKTSWDPEYCIGSIDIYYCDGGTLTVAGLCAYCPDGYQINRNTGNCDPVPSPAPSPSSSPLPMASPSPTPVPSLEPAPVDTPSPTPVPSLEPAPVDTPSPTPVPSLEPAPIDTPSPAPVPSLEPAPVD